MGSKVFSVLSQDCSVTAQLVEVATSSQSALLQLCDDSANLLPMTCLHLTAVSALLSRCPPPSPDQLSVLGAGRKQAKRKAGGEGLRQAAVKALQAFHEGVEGVLDKAGSSQEWSQARFSEGERARRKGDFARASFCQLVVSVFTILNEVLFLRYSGLC